MRKRILDVKWKAGFRDFKMFFSFPPLKCFYKVMVHGFQIETSFLRS